MLLSPGTTLGPYSVTAKIGEGGTGEVYRARRRSSSVVQRLGVLLMSVTLIAVGAESSWAQTYPEAVIPETHLRLLRSSFGRQAEYQISVALPHGYADAERSYPVLYILDANGQFGTVTEAVRALALIEQSIPQMIVVGIGYPVGVYWNAIPQRSIDLSPTKDAAWEAENAATNTRFPRALGSGGAPDFLRFISDELMPFIEHEYRTVPSDRGLYGFSRGGLFALYAMFHRPTLFQRYIAGSPSLWWDDGVTFRYEETFAREYSSLPARLFLSVGTDEPHERMVQPLRRFVDILEQRTYEGLTWSVHYFEGETHDSAVPGTISRGLKAVYDPPVQQ